MFTVFVFVTIPANLFLFWGFGVVAMNKELTLIHSYGTDNAIKRTPSMTIQ
jgi:hypothetical protein